MSTHWQNSNNIQLVSDINYPLLFKIMIEGAHNYNESVQFRRSIVNCRIKTDFKMTKFPYIKFLLKLD